MEIDDDVTFDDPAPETAAPADRNAVVITTSVSQIQAAMSEMDKIAASLPELAAKHPIDLVFDVTTPKGMAEAIAHRAAWRDPRIAVEKYRKTAKSPVLNLGKAIDARAAWLTERLEAGELPVHDQIKAEEARKAQERADREAREFGRITAMQEAVADFAMTAMSANGKPSAWIADRLSEMRAQVLDPAIYQEMMPQALQAQTAAIAKLETALKAAQWDEEKAAERAAEEARRKAEQEAADAERARIAAEQRAEAERLEQARQMIAKAEREANERLAAERAEFERQRAEFAAAQEAAKPRDESRVDGSGASLLRMIGELTGTDQAATLTISQIDQRLDPLCVTASVLTSLGFKKQQRPGPASHFLASDWPAICEALKQHIDEAARRAY